MPFCFVKKYKFACGCKIFRNDSCYISLYWYNDNPEADPPSNNDFTRLLPQLHNPQPHYDSYLFRDTNCRARFEVRSEGENMANYPAKSNKSARECWKSMDFERRRDFAGTITDVQSDMKTKLIAQAWLTRYEKDLKGDSTDVTDMVRDLESGADTWGL